LFSFRVSGEGEGSISGATGVEGGVDGSKGDSGDEGDDLAGNLRLNLDFDFLCSRTAGAVANF